MRWVWVLVWIFFGVGAQAAPGTYVREQQTVVVQGHPETWQLVWQGMPSPVCSFDDVDGSASCPCSGFAYGEMGKLSLTRSRDGQVFDTMDLGPLFDDAEHPPSRAGPGMAYLQRWPFETNDLSRSMRSDRTLTSRIERRPAPVLMKIANYDHADGGLEFLVRVGTLPCGKHQYSAVGVSLTHPELHALSTGHDPTKPLIMSLDAWQALLAGPAPRTILDSPCGDHGSATQTTLTVGADHGVVRVTSRNYSCPTNGAKPELLDTTEE